MTMAPAELTPIILGVGEYVDRPANPADALEPVSLMAAALRTAEKDGGCDLLAKAESVELVGLISWRYADPVSLLCDQLGISPARKVNASMGGETPIRLVHEAAVRIAKGEQSVALIVGGEALNARTKAKKAGVQLGWTKQVAPDEAVAFPASRYAVSDVAKQLGVRDPAQIYPLYEMATQQSWGQTPAEADAISAALWAQYAGAAAENPSAWIQDAPSADQIEEVTPDNRMINWPYRKLMVANPNVNQAAAIIVTSLAVAREAGVPEERIIHIWGGAAANEPEDYLLRDRYDHSTAQTAVLERAVEIAGGDAERFDLLELYSCFPVVPKMALRTLGLDPHEHRPTVTGGLTFFGGPLNNYMSHSVAAMVRRLRNGEGKIGLLYGQGGFVNKHHGLVVGTQPAASPLPENYSVQGQADAQRDPVPTLAEHYAGPAAIETYTIIYGRDGTPIQGIVIVRTPEGSRTMARVPATDETSLALLQSRERNAIGTQGQVRIDAFGKPVWETEAARDARVKAGYQFCSVEREGHLTIVTINRPQAMNALDPATNAELATIFDDFASDPDQWVAILTGAGDRAFSSGNDLKFTAKAMARGQAIESPVTGFAGLTMRPDLNKPVIAAVNGLAMGGGFEIALACDLIIASETAGFALPEPKVGLAALEGGLLRLPSQIGLKPAMGMILTGRTVSAAEGLQIGFVNEVVAPGDLLTAAKRWAQDIMACSPMSIRASKEIVRRGLEEESLEAALEKQRNYPAARALFRSADLREGPLAFAQKRAPHWKGR
ncbi:MAG TPA: enoyl-CoA hydratase-related protein [Sphingobium sp.]|nr:enoyl-CoA hydratase-related protein [Sphingobium sp.]